MKNTLGKGLATKSDDFLEKCQRGAGSFSIQKFILQILGTLNRYPLTGKKSAKSFWRSIEKLSNTFRHKNLLRIVCGIAESRQF